MYNVNDEIGARGAYLAGRKVILNVFHGGQDYQTANFKMISCF